MQARDLQEWHESPEEFVGRELEGAGFRDSLRPCAETLLACLFEVGCSLELCCHSHAARPQGLELNVPQSSKQLAVVLLALTLAQ